MLASSGIIQGPPDPLLPTATPSLLVAGVVRALVPNQHTFPQPDVRVAVGLAVLAVLLPMCCLCLLIRATTSGG